MEDAVDALLTAIESGTPPGPGIFAADVTLDATVPNWRFRVRGEKPVRQQLGGWYRHPARFEELRRRPLPDGELVEFTLTWEERGVPHAGHQAHVLRVENGRITLHTVFSGGRWPASLLAEMADAERTRT